MKALILAAGFGSRLAPITEIIPKPLLPVAGTSVIERNITKLKSFGITEIAVNLHHIPSLIKHHVMAISGCTFFFSEEDTILGTAGGIKKAIDFLGDDDFLVVNSDILSEVDYEALIHFHTRKNSDCTMALREDPNADMFGPVEIDKEGRVRRFLKTGLAGEYTKYMFTGVQVMNPNFLQNVKKGKYSDLSTEVYPQAVSESGNLFGFISKAFWIDIGKPLPLLQANSHFLSKHNTALQKEHVFHNASVLHATSDSKPSRETVFGSYVGQNVSIESRVKIENSIVMKGATIKKNSVVKNSIIAPETELGHDTIYENVMVATVNKQLKISGF